MKKIRSVQAVLYYPVFGSWWGDRNRKGPAHNGQFSFEI